MFVGNLFFSAPGQGDEQVVPTLVVWQDDRTGTWNIYAVKLNGPTVAECTSAMDGDINGDCKVDFKDFAVMASNWLGCNLEPQSSCWQ